MRPLVIGVGNRWRRDDGVGPRAADAVAGTLDDRVDVTTLDGEPARLLDAWDGRELVVVLDAVRAGAAPGTIHRVDALTGDVGDPAPAASSHAGGVSAAVELGRALGRLPGRLVVIGVEPADLAHGDGLSPAVDAALDGIVDLVATEVGAPTV